MRLLLLTCIGVALAGCDHMYGAGDAKVVDIADRELVALARAEAASAGIPLENKRAPHISDEGEFWIVSLDPPPRGWKGGAIEVSIDKQTWRVIGLERTR